MKTVKKTHKNKLKYKILSNKKHNTYKNNKSRVQLGCNGNYLGGQYQSIYNKNLSEKIEKGQDKKQKERQKIVNEKLKTKKIGIYEKRKKIHHFGRERRQQKTIKKILGESNEKARDCKLKRGPPRLKLGIRNFAWRRPQHIINNCYTY